MARARKTDETQALMAAMHLFWRDGFHTVGTRKLETETGITRFTLQNVYGGKRSLFLKALDAYLDEFERVSVPKIAAGGLRGVAEWFNYGNMPPDLVEARSHGCLLVNSVMEFPRDDTEVMDRADRFYGLLRAGFRDALARARETGEMRPEIDVEASTELLIGVAVAMTVMFKSSGPEANPDGLSAATAETIMGWRATA